MGIVPYTPPKVKYAMPDASLDVHTLVSKVMRLPGSCLKKKT